MTEDHEPRLFADDAVLHVPGESLLAGDHQGPRAIADGYFRRQRELSGSLSVEPVRMDVRDDPADCLSP